MASLPTVAHLVPLLPAGLALALMPGPNNLLSVQVAASDGVGAACRAGLGRLLAFALLLLAAAFGLAAVLRHAPAALALVQTAAAGYLLAIAGRLWREAAAPPAGDPTAADVDGARRAWCREFLVALGNPKCLLIATAFVPQCVDPARPAAPQLVAASLLVLALELLAVGAYAAAGRSLLRWLPTAAHWRRFGRGCALAMAAAALGLLWRTWGT
jgi:threonine/homoserine/homoserine lactone efflux protein